MAGWPVASILAPLYRSLGDEGNHYTGTARGSAPSPHRLAHRSLGHDARCTGITLFEGGTENSSVTRPKPLGPLLQHRATCGSCYRGWGG